LCAVAECAAAAALLQQATSHGHLPSRADLADMLIDGREGVAMDQSRSFALVEEGARLGCHHCQGVMARCYRGGVGCSRDAAAALALAQASAAKGSRYGQTTLEYLYRLGQGGVALDEATQWFKLGAAQGLAMALNSIGVYHHYGHGVAADRREAIRWYKPPHVTSPPLFCCESDHTASGTSAPRLQAAPTPLKR
jgi:TPR repeat protein